ncbi:helix-turn-helix transcriptional regulator [Flavonifractor sp. An91]|uniref:helix-turn-helix transcriptional regulator n=1 Tax=Flavonifractor sp. An91 TaxID=1965665 RepID=UPI0013A64A97|nr:winged helix-turn-helix domain-containing protein [Flavonifractor sp. An91]
MYQHALKLAETDTAREQIQKVGKNQLLSWKLLVEHDGAYHPTNGYLLLNGDMGSDFRINLYRKDAATDQNGVIDPKERDTDDTNDTKVEPNDTNEEAILRILRTNPKATQKDVVEMLGVSLATVKRLMNSLQKAGKIKRKGSNRSGSWVVIDQKE